MGEKFTIIEMMTKFQITRSKDDMWNLTRELRKQYELKQDWIPRQKLEQTPLKQIRKYLILTIQEIWLKETNRVTKTKEKQDCMILDLREIV